jgi:membrane-associated phospholipid phosphatase
MSVRTVLAHTRHPRTAGRTQATDGPTRHQWIRELELVLAGLLVYFGVRAATTNQAALAEAHARSLMRLEHTLGIARESDLQELILDHHSLVTVANWVYIWGHWPLIAVSAAWLFRHRPDAYRQMRTAIFASGAIGMIIFLAYPVAPPRLTGIGLTDTVTSYSHAYRALQPPALMDRYAALPSLHFGWDLLVGLTLARFHPRVAVRILGALMPVAMALAVVMTANHYILDVVVGGIVAMAGLGIAIVLIRALDQRAQRSPADAFDDEAAWSTHHC